MIVEPEMIVESSKKAPATESARGKRVSGSVRGVEASGPDGIAKRKDNGEEW